jgi:SAM-dependent methyltransferase
MLYDRIGTTYESTRSTDPRIAARIWAALGPAQTVVNVGAGTGHYEPADRNVVAVEPSDVMIARRPQSSAPVVRANAEALPFADHEFDAAMSVLSDHHWRDRAGGLRELRRVARRVVVFNYDVAAVGTFWLDDYLPQWVELAHSGMSIEQMGGHLGGAHIEPVAIPRDCRDGFLGAYWARPEAYLDPAVRANISVFARIDAEEGFLRLEEDLRSGVWQGRNKDLLSLDELDIGYRLLVAE